MKKKSSEECGMCFSKFLQFDDIEISSEFISEAANTVELLPFINPECFSKNKNKQTMHGILKG